VPADVCFAALSQPVQPVPGLTACLRLTHRRCRWQLRSEHSSTSRLSDGSLRETRTARQRRASLRLGYATLRERSAALRRQLLLQSYADCLRQPLARLLPRSWRLRVRSRLTAAAWRLLA